MSGVGRSRQALWWAVGLAVGLTPGASAQTIRGRVVDEANGSPVPMAGVYLLDAGRGVVSSALSDELGMYVLAVNNGGEFILRVQRLGYFETESPLLEVSGEHPYTVDLSVRPEPIRIQGLEVEVQMERQNSWANDRLRFMDPRWGSGDPAAAYGFRLITGMRLEEAKLRSKDSLDLLRWVYVPIYNSMDGMCVQTRPKFTRGGGGPFFFFPSSLTSQIPRLKGSSGLWGANPIEHQNGHVDRIARGSQPPTRPRRLVAGPTIKQGTTDPRGPFRHGGETCALWIT